MSSGFLHLSFTLSANCTLLLLEQNFARVCVVPQTFLHQALIRPQSAVSWCHAHLRLIQLHCQLCEIVALLQLRTRTHTHTHIYIYIYSVQKKMNPPPNILHLQVQTCPVLNKIKHALAQKYFSYCRQISYDSIIPFNRFSIFTNCCNRFQLLT